MKENFELLAEPALVEALIIGFTRMGILHNLARLSSGALPERQPEESGNGSRSATFEWEI